LNYVISCELSIINVHYVIQFSVLLHFYEIVCRHKEFAIWPIQTSGSEIIIRLHAPVGGEEEEEEATIT